MQESVHVVCPRCGAVNRVPGPRLAEGPACGSCRARLFDGHPVELTAGTFDRTLERSDLPVLVDFWAPWCAPCRMMAPHFERAASEIEPRVRFGKVNTESEPEIGRRHGVQAIPTLVLFKGGREVARQEGAMSLDALVRWLRGLL